MHRFDDVIRFRQPSMSIRSTVEEASKVVDAVDDVADSEQTR